MTNIRETNVFRDHAGMYLKFSSNLDFPTLAKLLVPEVSESALEWDSENVYEWMWLDLPNFTFRLNVCRDHGRAYIEDESLSNAHNSQTSNAEWLGDVYISGWNMSGSASIATLPDSLTAYIAKRLSVNVFVYEGNLNVDMPDPKPLHVVSPSS